MTFLQSMPEEERNIYKAQKLKAIRDYNADFIKELGIPIADFNMKTPFYDSNGRQVVGIFPSEFRRSKGFFFELVNFELNPSDPERKIYRITPSDSYEEEYEMSSKNSYCIPVEELRAVHRSSVAISKMSAFTGVDESFRPKEKSSFKAPTPIVLEDAPYSELTIRDYYAIHTGKPVSAKPWLNELIKK